MGLGILVRYLVDFRRVRTESLGSRVKAVKVQTGCLSGSNLSRSYPEPPVVGPRAFVLEHVEELRLR